MQRVLVIGNTASGKTTLAAELSRRIGIIGGCEQGKRHGPLKELPRHRRLQDDQGRSLARRRHAKR